MKADDSTHQSLVEKVRRFVEQKIIPVASRLEHKDEYPEEIVEGFKQLGLFGANVSPEYGGLGLDYMTFATIIEELARGWMSVVGPIGTHSVACDVIGRLARRRKSRNSCRDWPPASGAAGWPSRRPTPAPTCNACKRRPLAVVTAI
jgi:alkylation response protein AidB-like acyl-CoA dehydrogenase